MSECPATLICPVCDAPLATDGRALRCPAGHSFDVAREGYVNLLTGRRPRYAGDDRAMLAARRRFLDSGHYAALTTAVTTAVLDHLSGYTNEMAHITDIGCGEGTYLDSLAQALRQERQPGAYCFSGIDLSRDAVRLAARRCPFAQFAVADAWRKVPLLTGATAVILNIFAPRNPAEFARIAAPGTLLLVVIPRPGHLLSIRERFGLLAIEQDKREQVMAQMDAGFVLRSSALLEMALRLEGMAVADLVQMTPGGRHLSPEQWAVVRDTTVVETVAQVELLAFTRRAGSGTV